jgi:hypothetical protein
MEDKMNVHWRKSSHSGNGGSDCVEVADNSRYVLVRDTKNRAGATLRFSPAAWCSFANRVKTGT